MACLWERFGLSLAVLSGGVDVLQGIEVLGRQKIDEFLHCWCQDTAFPVDQCEWALICTVLEFQHL